MVILPHYERVGIMDYDQFRAQYENQHPASIPKRSGEVSPFPLWVRALTWIMFICAALLSGVHTVPVVHAGIPTEGVAEWVSSLASAGAFAAVEMALLLSSFAMLGGAGWTVFGILVLSISAAMAANIYSVVNAYQNVQGGGDPGTLVVAVIIGIVAPGIAFLSGKLLANMNNAERALENRHTKALQEWDSEILRAWNKFQRASKKDSKLESDLEPAPKVVQSRSRPSERVRVYFQEHPDAVEDDPQTIADALGVSRSTVYSVRSKVLQNGHGG